MKKSILFLIPILALGMAACQRNNGKPTPSGGSTGSNPSSSGGGGGGGGDTHKGSLAPYGVGYEVKVGDYYFQLTEDTTVEDEDHVGCWKNADVQVDADSLVTYYNNGTPVSYFLAVESATSKNNVKETAGSSVALTSTTIYSSAETTTVTLDLWQSGSYTSWINGFVSKGTVEVTVDIVYDTGYNNALYFAASTNGNTLDTTTRLTWSAENHQRNTDGQFMFDVDKDVYCQFVNASYDSPSASAADWDHAKVGTVRISNSKTTITDDDVQPKGV